MLRLSVARYSGVQPPLLAVFGVRAAFQQQLAELVMAVVGRGQQRRPPVFRGLIDVGAGIEQQLRRLEIAFASRKHQRRQPTAAAADQAGDDDFVVVGSSSTAARTLASGSRSGSRPVRRHHVRARSPYRLRRRQRRRPDLHGGGCSAWGGLRLLRLFRGRRFAAVECRAS